MYPHCSCWKAVLNFSAVKFKYIYGLHLLVSGAYSLKSTFPFSFFIHFPIVGDVTFLLDFGVWFSSFTQEISDLCDSYSCFCLFFILFNSLFLRKNKGGQSHIQLCWWDFTGILCNSYIFIILNIGQFLSFLFPSFPCCWIGPWLACQQLICRFLTFSDCC